MHYSAMHNKGLSVGDVAVADKRVPTHNCYEMAL